MASRFAEGLQPLQQIVIGVGEHASVALGNREDFFGFSREHGAIRMTEVSAGHESAFVRLSEQRSSGGGAVSSARGRSLGFTLKRDFALSEDTMVSAAAHTDRFLGGEADLPVGTVQLSGGGWDHRASLSSATALTEDSTISVTANAHLPGAGEENLSVGVQFRKRF